jgi:NADPH:quinone reductase-like Zn-dependent oxidoreductase
MRAVVFDRYGDESVLQLRETPAPQPAANEVQVQVVFATLNPVDFKLRGGMFRLLRKPTLPAITGKDFAGRIVALGSGVQGLRLGQRVFGSVNPMTGRGSCAETVAISTDLIAATPASVSDEVAACLPVASGTALQVLETIAGLRAGQSVLVTGASGAVGSSAVQIARSLGARITGVCSAANVGYVKAIGADEVVDYKTTDWRSLAKIFDMIFDAAGASSFGAARKYLAPTGYYINTFPKPGMFITSKFTGLYSRQHSVPFMLKTDAALLQKLAQLAQTGVLQPRIARTVALEQVGEAQRDMQDGRVHGKVCVKVSG